MCPEVDSASKKEYQVNHGHKGSQCVRLTTYHLHVSMSRNVGVLTSWNPAGLFRPVMGQFYLYLYIRFCFNRSNRPVNNSVIPSQNHVRPTKSTRSSSEPGIYAEAVGTFRKVIRIKTELTDENIKLILTEMLWCHLRLYSVREYIWCAYLLAYPVRDYIWCAYLLAYHREDTYVRTVNEKDIYIYIYIYI
jgi:hypothetical protein